MEPAHLLVHTAASVSDGGDKDFTFQQVAAAEAALAVAAVGINGNPGALQRNGNRLGSRGVDHILMDAAQDGDLKSFGLCALRVTGQRGDIGAAASMTSSWIPRRTVILKVLVSVPFG